jgi:hypothetical protein
MTSTARVLIATIAFSLLLSGCTTFKNVDASWLKSNCPAVASFYADSCEGYSNCSQGIEPTMCQCQYDNGTYHGEIKDGKFHGGGRYDWESGVSYLGHWLNGAKSCGIESNSNSDYFVFRNGEIIRSGNNISNAVVAVAAVAVIYAATTSGGGGGTLSDSDWDWDWQPANATWVCRGITTGQYAALSNCQYDIKDDNRWPG